MRFIYLIYMLMLRMIIWHFEVGIMLKSNSDGDAIFDSIDRVGPTKYQLSDTVPLFQLQDLLQQSWTSWILSSVGKANWNSQITSYTHLPGRITRNLGYLKGREKSYEHQFLQQQRSILHHLHHLRFLGLFLIPVLRVWKRDEKPKYLFTKIVFELLWNL
jgi:hypothetical protein